MAPSFKPCRLNLLDLSLTYLLQLIGTAFTFQRDQALTEDVDNM
jgi:hypothetical protein